MAQCRHHEICGRDALEGDDACILHSYNLQKDKKSFDTALDEHLKEQGECFSHFVFAHEANFRDRTFHTFARFNNVTFMQRADFSEVTFSDGADFRDTNFRDFASFFKAVFQNSIDFSHAEFSQAAEFSNANFEKYAGFFYATFTKIAKFPEANFSSVSFTLAKFHDWTSFTKTTFKETVWFRQADFMARPDFWNTRFAEADFTQSRFSNGADFFGSTFSKNVLFDGAEFLGRTSFLPREADGHGMPIFAGAVASFSDVAIAPLDVLTFRDTDLKNCLFSGTDLRKAEFANVTWPRIVSNKYSELIRKRWPKIGRNGVFDEIEARRKGETHKYPHIEQLYRQLKQNCEDRRDYERASDFHYGEKQMRRKNKEVPAEDFASF